MKKHERHPTTYLSQDDVTRPQVFTIDCVILEPIDGQDGTKKIKPVLYFSEKASKPLILNKVNDETLSALFGDDDEAWQGHKIEVFADKTVMFGGRAVGGVRIRLPRERVRPVATAEQTNVAEKEEIPF